MAASDIAPPRPMCFVAMPFGKKPPPGRRKPVIDFERIYGVLRKAVEAERVECIKADYELTGGFIHRAMFERLLVAEYVIADLTFANANVTYEVGVRHGATRAATLLTCAENFIAETPFDFRPLRLLPYRLEDDGTLGPPQAKRLSNAVRERLREALAGELPLDNPIMQVTDWSPEAGGVQHTKTDVFLKRMSYASEIGERIAGIIALADEADAVRRLDEIRDKLIGDRFVVPQLHTALIALYLSYREKRAYGRMVELFKEFPSELKRRPVALEQRALALNRLAEAAEKAGERGRAGELRQQALATLDRIEGRAWTSETWGIRGRVHKGWHDAEARAGNESAALAQLGQAIDAYERGFRADPRDYYPGVNAVTLRLARNRPEDRERLDQLVPVVRFAVERAAEPTESMERYWLAATKLELATAARDWEAADRALEAVLAIPVQSWLRETTAGNLLIQRKAFKDDAEARRRLKSCIEALDPKQEVVGEG